MAEKPLKLILSGEDANTSRNFLLSLRKRYSTVEILNGAELDQQLIEEKILTEEMFSTGEKLVVIEGLPKDKNWESLNSADQNIVIWITGSLGVKAERALSAFTKRDFSDAIPVNAFAFTNKFFVKDLTGSVLALDRLIEKRVPFEMLIGAINYRLRQLAILKAEGTLTKVKPTQLQKLEAEARQWSEPELAKLYDELTSLDEMLKNGKIKYKSGFLNLIYALLLPS